MAKRNRTKKTMIYKTLHRKLDMDEHKPYLNQGYTQVTKTISSSCSTSGISCVIVVNYPVIIPELQKDGIDLRKPITGTCISGNGMHELVDFLMDIPNSKVVVQGQLSLFSITRPSQAIIVLI
jgi:hypothetical protein